MSRWWRAYDEAVDDPKLQQLPAELFRAWFNICCVTSQNGGHLPTLDAVAFKLRLKPAKANKLLGDLRAAGLIDESEDGSLRPHNWDGRQFKSDAADGTNAERQQRYRDRHRNAVTTVTPPVTETVTVTDPYTDTDTDTEKKDAASSDAPSAVSDPEKQLFERGKEIFGLKSGGSLTAKLLKSKTGNVSLARAAIETAATKQDPREYIGAIIRGRDSPDDARARGDAW